MTRAIHRRFIATSAATAVLLALIGLSLISLIALASDEIPPEAAVAGVIGHPQTYVLSCESRSAADWSGYFGADLSEKEILAALPRTDNPETGFVGSPSGTWGMIPPNSYGVHPPPLAKVLRDRGVPAQEQTGLGWDNLRREIAARKPVIVWIIGQMWNGTPIRYTASNGQTTTVAYYEHVMILVGYTQKTVHVVDAYSGTDQYYDVNTFLTSWAVLGERAITYSGDAPQQTGPQLTPGGPYTVQRGETLSKLAARYGVNWMDLAALNGIEYPYTLYAGQQINLPGSEGEAAQTSGVAVAFASPTETPQPTPTIQPTATEIPTSSASTQPASSAERVTVHSGDTLAGIARKYGIAWQELVQTNRLAYPYFLYPRQVLALPPSAKANPSATEAASPEPTPTAVPASDTGSTYTVQKGDYLIDLARRFGLDWQELAQINALPYPYRLYPGQVLKLR
ncbi:MAG TPA: LysM peptidoglycan-binding domain-containing protein [Anaerolineaceae bacterium]